MRQGGGTSRDVIGARVVILRKMMSPASSMVSATPCARVPKCLSMYASLLRLSSMSWPPVCGRGPSPAVSALNSSLACEHSMPPQGRQLVQHLQNRNLRLALDWDVRTRPLQRWLDRGPQFRNVYDCCMEEHTRELKLPKNCPSNKK